MAAKKPKARATTSSKKPNGIKPLKKAEKIVWTNYGVSGIGKTRLIGETEQRTLIVRPPTEHTDAIRSGNVVEWIVHDWGEMDDVKSYMRHDGGADEFDWVWADSITGLQQLGLDDVWKDVTDRRPDRARYGPDKGEYGVNMWRLGQWMRDMVGTPGFHFGMTAHPMNVEGLSRPDEVLLGPLVGGKNMPHQVCHMSTIVTFYAMDDKDRRVLYTNLSDEFFAKDQYDGFDGKLINPTMEKVMAGIQGKKPKRRPAARKATRRRAK